jgi:hypothetical protein
MNRGSKKSSSTNRKTDSDFDEADMAALDEKVSHCLWTIKNVLVLQGAKRAK